MIDEQRANSLFLWSERSIFGQNLSTQVHTECMFASKVRNYKKVINCENPANQHEVLQFLYKYKYLFF